MYIIKRKPSKNKTAQFLISFGKYVYTYIKENPEIIMSTIKLETTTSCIEILQQSRYRSLSLYLLNTQYLIILLFKLITRYSIVIIS